MSQKTVRPERKPPTTIPTERKQHEIEIVDELDALLDEIDGVLEENTLEVLQTYHQRGGE